MRRTTNPFPLRDREFESRSQRFPFSFSKRNQKKANAFSGRREVILHNEVQVNKNLSFCAMQNQKVLICAQKEKVIVI